MGHKSVAQPCAAIVPIALLFALFSVQCGGSGSGSTDFSDEESAHGGSSQGLFFHVNAGNGTVEVFEVGSGSRSRFLTGLSGPRGVAVLGNRTIVVADRNQVGSFHSRARHGLSLSPPSSQGFHYLKSLCATLVADEFIAADQGRDEIARLRIHPDGSIVELWRARTGPSPRGMLVDGAGQVWVACKNGNLGVERGRPGYVRVHSPVDGEELLSFETPFGARDLALDREGRVWVTCFGDQVGPSDPRTGQLDKVVRLDPFGHQVELTVGRGPFGIAADVTGHVFVACSTDNEVYKLDPDGAIVRAAGWPVRFDAVRDLAGGGCTTVAPDGMGRIWVEFKASPFVVVLDGDTGAIRQLIRASDMNGTEALGDRTGYHMAMILFPGADHDRDGITNLDELLGRSNPFAIER